MLRARLDFAVQAERAKADAADVAAEIAVDAVERRRRERRFGAVGASTDEALEVNGRTWRLVPPFPTEDDIPLVDKANEPSVARGPAAEGDNAAGGMAPVLAPRPVQPHNRAVGAFPSLAAYLSTHYFLTREDCLAALRAGVLAQRELREQGNENAARGGLPVYRDACAVGLAFSRRGVGWRLRFSLGGKPGGKRKSVQSSRLMTGSLLCLAEASDKAWSRPIFAVVSNRTDSLLEHHLGPFIDIEEVVADAEPRFDPSLSYTMVESTAYFEAYRSRGAAEHQRRPDSDALRRQPALHLHQRAPAHLPPLRRPRAAHAPQRGLPGQRRGARRAAGRRRRPRQAVARAGAHARPEPVRSDPVGDAAQHRTHPGMMMSMMMMMMMMIIHMLLVCSGCRTTPAFFFLFFFCTLTR
mmetsp:Transcript_29392/g.67435  ORF Transcript_29392/g.67435 Transcript_29392/m.67435 type:complete len:412 (+) Transcript_29392:350-1585(+)